MRKLKLFASSVAVLSSLALVGCGGGTTPSTNPGGSTNTPSGETVKLTVWGPSEQTDLLKDMVSRFKAANPGTNYDITVNVCSEADAYANLKPDVARGADVYAFANDQLINLIRIGALAKVGGTNLDAVYDNNTPESVSTAEFNGDVYAYPYAADNGYFMYYNKAVLGTTTERLDDILDLLNSKNKKFLFEITNAWYNAGFFFATGCNYNVEYNANGTEKSIDCDFDSANGVIAGKAMVKLANHPAFMTGNDNNIKAGFVDGSIAAAVTGTWNASAIEQALGSDYAAVKLPKFTVDGTDYQLKSFAGFKLMGVNPNSKHLVEAHKLAGFLTGEDMQKLRLEEKSVIPSNVNAYDANKINSNIALKALEEQKAFSVPQTSVPEKFWDALGAFGTEVNAKTVTDGNVLESLEVVVQLIKSISSAS